MFLVPVPSSIQLILQHITGKLGWSLSLMGSGATSVAWLAERGDEALVVRAVPKNSDKPVTYPVEMAILQQLHERKQPVPQPLASSHETTLPQVAFAWAVAQQVGGQPVKADAIGTQSARQLGRLLITLHGLPVSGWGVLHRDAKRLYATQPDALTGALERWNDYSIWPLDNTTLEQHAIMRVAPHLCPQLERLAPAIRAAASEGRPAICHSDLHGDHIFLEGDHVTGVIDFGDACALPPAWEFAIASRHYGWTTVDRILQVYEPRAEARMTLRDQAVKLSVITNMMKLERHVLRHDTIVKRALTLRALLRTLAMLPETIVIN